MSSDTLPKCCQDLEIDPLHLIFPELMGADGLEFVTAHGLYSISLEEMQKGAVLQKNGWVRIQHQCQQLQPDGRCAIYASRPAICRKFDCATRVDCACHKKGWLSLINGNGTDDQK